MRRLHLLWSKICKEILVGFNVLAARQGATRCMTTKKKSMMEIESVEAAGKSNIGRVKRKKDESHESEFKDAINVFLPLTNAIIDIEREFPSSCLLSI
ncbi:hypothetical protein WN943_019117 [Citrus x changshan-huyou]